MFRLRAALILIAMTPGCVFATPRSGGFRSKLSSKTVELNPEHRLSIQQDLEVHPPFRPPEALKSRVVCSWP
jgi:hypothetical protein